jgi:hypothetical protein
MPDYDPVPPETFEVAAERFGEFLAEAGFPRTICWLTHDDILIGCRDYRFLVHPIREAGLSMAKIAYLLGLKRELGIALTAMCASDQETFANVIVPEDDLDRQYRLMGKALKLSHPTERRKTTVVFSDLRWNILRSRYAEHSKMLWL